MPCQTIVKVLPAVITSLEREASERGGALVIGLCKVVKQYDFISSLYMICDILPPVSRLSRIFESTIDLEMMDSLVSCNNWSCHSIIIILHALLYRSPHPTHYCMSMRMRRELLNHAICRNTLQWRSH